MSYLVSFFLPFLEFYKSTVSRGWTAKDGYGSRSLYLLSVTVTLTHWPAEASQQVLAATDWEGITTCVCVCVCVCMCVCTYVWVINMPGITINKWTQ